MDTIDVFVLLSVAQKLTCELIVQNRFGWQVDDVLPGRIEDEQVLKFVVRPESESQYAAFIGLLEQQKTDGTIRDFLPKPSFLSATAKEVGEDAQTDRLFLAPRVFLAEETLSIIETGWIAQELAPEQLAIVQDALQEYMDRRQLLRSAEGVSLDIADPSQLILKALADIILYSDDPEERCDLSPLSTAQDNLEQALKLLSTPEGVSDRKDGQLEVEKARVQDPGEALLYQYTAEVSTHQMLEQTVEIASAHLLSRDELGQRVFEEAEQGRWREGEISQGIDIDSVDLERIERNGDQEIGHPLHSLEDLSLEVLSCHDSYLIVRNGQGKYELWHALAADEFMAEMLEYDAEAYGWCTTADQDDALEKQIEHEKGK